jgi:hypothetical protein
MARKTKSPAVDPAVERLLAAFVEGVRRLPNVETVLVSEEFRIGAIRVYTVIDSEPFDYDQRHPVYEAEIPVYEQAADVEVSFRVINRREIEDPLEMHLPNRNRLLYQRSGDT